MVQLRAPAYLHTEFFRDPLHSHAGGLWLSATLVSFETTSYLRSVVVGLTVYWMPSALTRLFAMQTRSTKPRNSSRPRKHVAAKPLPDAIKLYLRAFFRSPESASGDCGAQLQLFPRGFTGHLQMGPHTNGTSLLSSAQIIPENTVRGVPDLSALFRLSAAPNTVRWNQALKMRHLGRRKAARKFLAALLFPVHMAKRQETRFPANHAPPESDTGSRQQYGPIFTR